VAQAGLSIRFGSASPPAPHAQGNLNAAGVVTAFRRFYPPEVRHYPPSAPALPALFS
jgi:hypothetical protein